MKLQIFAILVVGLFLGASFSSAQVRNEPCKCADKDLLLDALNISQAAIQELNAQLEHLKGSEAAHGGALYNDKLDKELEEILRGATDQVRKGSGDEFGGYQMNRGDCSIRESGQNWCAREIDRSLIDVYKKACEEKTNVPIEQNPYRELRQVILHKISAYQAMQNFILETLKSLPKTCRPNNWFGYIVLQRVFTSVDEEPLPPRPRSGPYGAFSGGTRTTNKKDIEIGTVFVREGKPTSIRASMTSTENGASGGSLEVNCGAAGWKTGTESNTFESFLKGENNGDVVPASNRIVLKVNPANQTYDVYTGVFPRVNLTGEKVSSAKTAFTACRNDLDRPGKPEPFTSSASFAPYSVTNEKIKPGSPDFLEGSRTVKPPEFNRRYKQGNVTTTLTQEILFRWMLVRLPAK